MNAVSRAITSSADCSRSARKNTERLSIDEDGFGWLAKADNALGATHTRRKCLIRLQTKYVIGEIPSSNSCPIISGISVIAGCIVTCFHAEFATGSTPRSQPKEPI